MYMTYHFIFIQTDDKTDVFTETKIHDFGF